MIDTLVVDDEYFVRKGFISTMPWEQFGIRIVGEAADGIKAIEFMRQHHVELLITDLAMPTMNGFDLMRQARSEFPDIHIVVLSCHEDFKYIQDALRLGAIDYVVKTELEQENMQDSLKRIIDRISKPQETLKFETEQPLNLAAWSEEDEKRLQAHIDEWLPLYWVVNDQTFERLSDQLIGIQPPISKLQKVIHYLLVEWNRMLGADFLHPWLQKLDRIDKWEAWLPFIMELRDQLRHDLKVATYPDDVVDRILKAVELVKTNMDSKMTQSNLARQLNMNRGYFSKCFKEVIGINFQEYMKGLRISKAKLLLLQTTKSIMDIAEECGFQDHRYFSRQFRLEIGMLPSEYRNRQV